MAYHCSQVVALLCVLCAPTDSTIVGMSGCCDSAAVVDLTEAGFYSYVMLVMG